MRIVPTRSSFGTQNGWSEHYRNFQTNYKPERNEEVEVGRLHVSGLTGVQITMDACEPDVRKAFDHVCHDEALRAMEEMDVKHTLEITDGPGRKAQ